MSYNREMGNVVRPFVNRSPGYYSALQNTSLLSAFDDGAIQSDSASLSVVVMQRSPVSLTCGSSCVSHSEIRCQINVPDDY